MNNEAALTSVSDLFRYLDPVLGYAFVFGVGIYFFGGLDYGYVVSFADLSEIS